MQAKKELRSRIQAQRSAIPLVEKAAYDARIRESLWSLVQERKCKKVHLFLPMKTEVNLYPFIQKLLDTGVKIYTPKTLKKRKLEHLELYSLKELEEGLWGTKHPKNSQVYEGTFDLIIVPGLAFDLGHNRLGYGGGYYDNFLKNHPNVYKVALAYPFQIQAEVPVEAHDTKVDAIVYH